eukprot:5480150-Pyramimonas_sp.AAC.1
MCPLSDDVRFFGIRGDQIEYFEDRRVRAVRHDVEGLNRRGDQLELELVGLRVVGAVDDAQIVAPVLVPEGLAITTTNESTEVSRDGLCRGLGLRARGDP